MGSGNGRRWVAAVVTAVVAGTAASGARAADPPTGPAGDGFYAPPAASLPGPVGSVVWQRPATGIPALRAAARTTTVLYRSRSGTGAPIASSGTVAVPPGTPPRGGWPIVSWFHVTTGAGDRCAPSRATADNPELERLTRGDVIASRLLAAGIAVARVDGEGIGTPGPHPYLVGPSLMRSQVDLVRAARELDPRISARWVAAGHSEGGVATLFSAAQARRYAPELDLRGAAAFAPLVDAVDLIGLFRLIPLPLAPVGAGTLAALGGLIAAGAAEDDPRIAAALRTGLLGPRATALLGHLESRCLTELGRADSWGGLAPSEVPGPRFDALWPVAREVLERHNVRRLAFGDLPIRVDVGVADAITNIALAERFAAEQRARGTRLTYQRWPSATHETITGDAQAARAGVRWIVDRLAPGDGPEDEPAPVPPATAPRCAPATRGPAARRVRLVAGRRHAVLRLRPRTDRRLRIAVERPTDARGRPRTRTIRRRAVPCRTFRLRLARDVRRVRISARGLRPVAVRPVRGSR
ncbi:lipase family protein [Patulibacter brassicae]|uniref:Lipase family protein n=1 Tax=Patulibacter brassicae TaxID=1705717 RepID=A0ABU4VK19_9ACTN|nr:lipase family protein [Patulibacter brassicae]MDX8151276.1 lipase family protein [Patulibacter brassicae]